MDPSNKARQPRPEFIDTFLVELQAQIAAVKNNRLYFRIYFYLSDNTYLTISLASSGVMDGCASMGTVPQLPIPPLITF